MSACPNCGELRKSHHVCPACGFYGDKEVVKTKIILLNDDMGPWPYRFLKVHAPDLRIMGAFLYGTRRCGFCDRIRRK